MIEEEKAEYANLYLHQIIVLAVRTTEKAEWCQQSLFNLEVLHYLILCLRHSSHIVVATPTVILNIPCWSVH